MQTSIDFEGRRLTVTLTNRASLQLAQQAATLSVEMELLFSCLIRKRVRFGVTDAPQQLPGIAISFRPVMTKKCDIHAVSGQPDVTAFPIEHQERYIPKWLRIDYREGEWQGEFGYVDS
jgi:hypothetical protein